MDREVIYFTDERGRDAVKVPIANRPGSHATADADDYRRLRQDGLTGPWYMNSNRKNGQEYLRTNVSGVSGKQVTVARAILHLGRREVARYHGSRTDVRRCNLYVEAGKAKRSDAGEALAARREKDNRRASLAWKRRVAA